MLKNSKGLVVVAVSFLVTTAMLPARAADYPQSGNVPDVKVGDHWEYQSKGLFDNERRTEYSLTVTAVDADHITLKRRDVESGRTKTLERERDWSDVSTPGHMAGRYLSFPLTPGKSWDTDQDVTNSVGNRVKWSTRMTVEGVERITVPAGTFDAIKVRGFGNWHILSTARSDAHSSLEMTLWYVPAIKQIVRHELIVYPSTRSTVYNGWTEELTAYSLKP
ncbi:hypothetical protein [Trinickia acidisoli]|uniref:hypothetical protein n=1 Tax=Trinickia acidisoli TaxID=2767482 RepID=UPI001A8F0FFA|nr:hypothetical protein [Trinickia acidisoli]